MDALKSVIVCFMFVVERPRQLNCLNCVVIPVFNMLSLIFHNKIKMLFGTFFRAKYKFIGIKFI